jgi:carbon-monoxide dehydrogenase large subunit
MASVQVAIGKKRILGLPLKRIEDPKLVTGSARYIDDIKLSGSLHAAFVRSAYAHAKILKIDVSHALECAGVKWIITGNDIKNVKNMPTIDDEPEKKATPRPVLAIEEVNYVGEPLAVVLAEDVYSAEDAAEMIDVRYEPLEVVEDSESALKPDSPRVHDYLENNVAYHVVHEVGDVEKAFREADEVIKVEFLNQRVAPVSLEPRGIIASHDVGNDALTIWASIQDPHGYRSSIADILNIHESRIRLIVPEVGGAFGAKIAPYPEDVAVAYASMKLKRPIKWIESRRENLLATTHGRGQKQYAEIAVKRDGRILALKVKIIADCGAYNNYSTVEIPETTYKMVPGAYDIAAYRAELFCVFTNKVNQEAYRGAGRPEACYLIERIINIVARKLKLDPVKIRQINYIKKERFPFKSVGGYIYDSGDYEGNLRKALEFSDYERLKHEQREAREKGRLLGIGLVTWIEVCGFGPDAPQTAAITVTKNGDVIIALGGHPHGQGHATPFLQIVADEFGIDTSRISVISGDTGLLPWSSVTAGSRSGALTGSAVLLSARKIKEKMSKIAAHLLDVKNVEMNFEGGKVFSAGSPNKSVEFTRVARAAYQPERLPAGMEPTLFEYTAFVPSNNVFPFGTHIAIVEVDKETGAVKLLKYYATDDCGRVLNPLIVEGQVHGGIVQGIGQAILEQVIYDKNGQNLTSTLADYAMPSAELIPEIRWTRTETLTYSNPLGVKGIGEAGAIASTPVIVNAIEDALAPYDIIIDRMPLRSDYIKSLIKD